MVLECFKAGTHLIFLEKHIYVLSGRVYDLKEVLDHSHVNTLIGSSF